MKKLIKYVMTLVLTGGFCLTLNAQDVIKEERFDNGQLKSSVLKYDREIEVVNYFDNGQVKEKFYLIDLKRHGVFEAYYQDGSRHMVVEYSNNTPAGDWKVWNRSGSLIANAVFENGKVKSGNMWDEEGNPIAFQE